MVFADNRRCPHDVRLLSTGKMLLVIAETAQSFHNLTDGQSVNCGGGGGGGFFSLARIVDDCSTIHSPPAHFFKVKISSHTLIPLFSTGLVHSGLAILDDCGRVFPDELHWSSFPDTFPHYARTAANSANSDFVWSSVYACLGVTCHLHFW